MISEDDRCRCGHHRSHHVLPCKAMRPVGTGSTPPGFRQHMERCPCLGFVMWKTAEEAEAGLSTVGTLLLCLIFLPLLTLALLKGGQAGVCWMNGDAVRYCDGYAAVDR